MAKSIKNRVFGSDVPDWLKQKIALRQQLSKTFDFGEAIQGAADSLVDVVDMHSSEFNFPYDGERGQILADLSSRTPFARMWTALSVFKDKELKTVYTGKDEING